MKFLIFTLLIILIIGSSTKSHLFIFVENSQICNFADDNTLTFADLNIDNIINKLQDDIRILDSWFKNNCMLLNEDKCQFIIIEPTRTSCNNVEKLKIEENI